MTPDRPPIIPYTVTFTVRVQEHLRQLMRVARERGDGEVFLDAFVRFYERLRIFPQFGDPLSDMPTQSGQLWIGIIPPLSMRYAIFEARRTVAIGALPVLLARRRSPG